MVSMSELRILLVDDNEAIHEDFRKILASRNDDEDLLEEGPYKKKPGTESKTIQPSAEAYSIDSAFQGEEAIEKVKQAIKEGRPYALAFVDMRMPPGIDGLQTIKGMWEADPLIQTVICTAYSDASWEETNRELKGSDNFLILKKPFEVIEIRQLAASLTKKWSLRKQVQYQIDNLQALVKERTAELEQAFSLTSATLEATQEGIVAITEGDKITNTNKIFLDLWDIPESLLSSGAQLVFQKMAEHAEEPKLLLTVLNDLLETKKVGNIKEWKTKSGKILELYSEAQVLHDKAVGCVISFRDITERKHLDQQLLHQATHDNLTGLPNRGLLRDRIEQAVAHAKRYELQVGILLFDLDGFKKINDALGHAAGDTLLKLVPEKLKPCIRADDTIARLGGDEFVIILSAITDQEVLIEKANEILQIFAVPCTLDNHKVTVTASIGICVYPKDGDQVDELLKHADAALYYAKEKGRNNFKFYSSEFNQYILDRVDLIAELYQALKKNEFTLEYQPFVILETGKITGMEALLRWEHPTLGTIMPDTFIPLAAEAGLMVSIGEWVLKKACLQLRDWHQSVNPELKISVNICAQQFQDPAFVSIVKGILQETEIEPKYVELEITEVITTKSPVEALEKMNELKAMGVTLSVDDFGTGYISLSYLKHFPFDKIKIDKRFIDGATINQEDEFIIDAIISMSKKMGVEVLTEGVENNDQVQFLLQRSGKMAQGFYFSKPLKEAECMDALKKAVIRKNKDI